MTEHEMVEWHHRLSGHGFEQTLGVSEGQGILVHCISWIPKSQTQLSDWKTTKPYLGFSIFGPCFKRSTWVKS